VGTLDTSCGSCGAAVRTEQLPLPPVPAAFAAVVAARDTATVEPAPAAAEASVRVPARSARRSWSTIVLAIVASLALIAAVALGVSRSHAAAQLTDTRGRLDAATTQAGQLESQVQQLQASTDQLQTDLDTARSVQQEKQKALTACQQIWETAARWAHGGTPSPEDQVRFTSQLQTCFEGKVPHSLF
jgi:uncharacterized protein HemX